MAPAAANGAQNGAERHVDPEDDARKAGYLGPTVLAPSLSPRPLPIVGIPACVKMLPPHPFHSVGDKYLRAVSNGAKCLPLLIPAIPDFYGTEFVPSGAGPDSDFIDELLAPFDGLLFTGSVSNLHPSLYDSDHEPLPPHDPHRDNTTLPLIRRAIAKGIPFLCICKGIQELNVACGGKLHPRVWEVPGMRDHREDKHAPIEDQYSYSAHDVEIVPGGVLESIFGAGEGGAPRTLHVNSLHSQGIAVPGSSPKLRVEARSVPDNLVEALSVENHPFGVGVQWHPEWRFWDQEDSAKLFAVFGKKVREHAMKRRKASQV
ncbi:peptidase C26 [Hyaloraphidium curvatum]|nr:peptidase C26 [Hyaloraphidium curvatum]